MNIFDYKRKSSDFVAIKILVSNFAYLVVMSYLCVSFGAFCSLGD